MCNYYGNQNCNCLRGPVIWHFFTYDWQNKLINIIPNKSAVYWHHLKIISTEERHWIEHSGWNGVRVFIHLCRNGREHFGIQNLEISMKKMKRWFQNRWLRTEIRINQALKQWFEHQQIEKRSWVNNLTRTCRINLKNIFN